MMVFEHTHVVMPHCDLIIHANEEDVVDAWMLEVVETSGDQATHLLQIVKLQFVLHPAFSCEVVKGLANVSCVRLVVVSNVLVASSESAQKAHQVSKV